MNGPLRNAARILLAAGLLGACSSTSTTATAPPATVIVTVAVTEPAMTLTPLPDILASVHPFFPNALGFVGDAKTVTVSPASLDQRFQKWLATLGFSAATVSLMEHTKPADGIQHAAGRNCAVTWTNDGTGLTLIVEAVRNT